MAIASAPSINSTMTWDQFSARLASGASPLVSMVKVGSVVVNPNDNTVVPAGGTFDVWYNRATHTLLVDITDTQFGGPFS